MWTLEDRVLVGDFGAGQALSDEQYRLLAPLIPPAKPGGRPRTTDMRRLLDGLFYVVRTGCHHLVAMLRVCDGREPSPTAAIIDTQSVKTTERGDHAAGMRRSG